MRKLFILAVIITPFFSFSQGMNLTLRSNYTLAGTETGANVWGYVDTTGREYALLGTSAGLRIIDVTNPVSPVPKVLLAGTASDWREVKTRGKYAYVTNEGGGGLKIYNIGSLPSTAGITVNTWTGDSGSGFIGTSHTLWIENNFLYLYGSNFSEGANVVDITNPTVPAFVGEYSNATSTYIHDGYVRNDTLYGAHINGGFFSVVDFTNKSAPVELATQNTPFNYTHTTWLSTNGKVLYTTDEINSSFLTAYDISNLSNITELDRIRTKTTTGGTVHETRIINVGGNDYAVSSWWQDGFKIIDAGRPWNLVEVGSYDTEPFGTGTGPYGTWGVYPYLPSGNILVSSIDNGLFVFTPNYVRACYLEGMVTDSITGLPIPTAKVEIIGATTITDSTLISGSYAMGTVTAGTYTVKFSKTGYYSKIFSGVSLSSGLVDSMNVELVPFIPLTITGQVLEQGTGTPVAFANVRLNSIDNTFTATANASGNFSISGYEDIYDIYSGKWGHVTAERAAVNVNSTSVPLTIQLDKGYYDDFTFNEGWSESSTATNGKWIRGKPFGSMSVTGLINCIAGDDSTDFNEMAFVTGNATGSGGSVTDNVGGGYTRLTSPILDLSTYTNPYIYFKRWYKANGSSVNDTFAVYLDNGLTRVAIELDSNNSVTNAIWKSSSYRVLDHLSPSASMRVIVYAVDNAPNSTVEAIFDKFQVTQGPLGVEDHANDTQITVYPNPGSGIFYFNGLENNSLLEITDLSGRVILKSELKSNSFSIDLSGKNRGLYLYRIASSNSKTYNGKIILY